MRSDPCMPRIVRAEGAWLDTGGRRAHFRRHLVLVGHHPRPPPPEDRRSHSETGRTARPGHFRRLHPSSRRKTWRGWAYDDHSAGLRARVLFRQRLDRGRSRAENGARVLEDHGASRATASSRWSTAIMATRSARCRWARAGVFNAPYEPLLFDVGAFRSRPRPCRNTLTRSKPLPPRRRRRADRGAADPRRGRDADLFRGSVLAS